MTRIEVLDDAVKVAKLVAAITPNKVDDGIIKALEGLQDFRDSPLGKKGLKAVNKAAAKSKKKRQKKKRNRKQNQRLQRIQDKDDRIKMSTKGNMGISTGQALSILHGDEALARVGVTADMSQKAMRKVHKATVAKNEQRSNKRKREMKKLKKKSDRKAAKAHQETFAVRKSGAGRNKRISV